ncbi:LOW QUALITY PROTEIN: uncharacterized protein ACNS7B_007803, partial [Menidia menidia]
QTLTHSEDTRTGRPLCASAAAHRTRSPTLDWPQEDASPQDFISQHAAGQASRAPGALGPAGCPGWASSWAWLLLGAWLLPGAWSFLTEEQEELLVELHNHYRGQVSPSASACCPLKWDPALKLLAQDYAAKCIWNHNPELEDTGENLSANSGNLDFRDALEKWFLEHLHYDYHNNTCAEEQTCGHYTQMVWADTHKVGCAFHLCDSMEGLGWERAAFLVCNYFPAGNYEDERPYVEGDWCSSCPDKLQKCENNLCVEEDPDEDPEGVTPDPSLLPPGGGASAGSPEPPVQSTTAPSSPSVASTPPEEDPLLPGTATEAPPPTLGKVGGASTKRLDPNKSIKTQKPGLTRIPASAGSGCAPPALLACCLTGLLLLWL